MEQALSADAIEAGLADLPGWSYSNDMISKQFEFGGFPEAMGFITRVAFAAEAVGHHPELFNVYNKVTLSLSTHDAGGKVTRKDLELAAAIEGFNWLPTAGG
ncbi:MAG: 4a-hydroxytetrahydrobiopterin dehydratase [Planctomycetota bacterium]